MAGNSDVTIAGAFRWRKSKLARNLADHGVHFGDAVGVFDGQHYEAEDFDHDEQRWTAVGFDSIARLLRVAFTWDEDEDGAAFRWILSARRAEAADEDEFDTRGRRSRGRSSRRGKR